MIPVRCLKDNRSVGINLRACAGKVITLIWGVGSAGILYLLKEQGMRFSLLICLSWNLSESTSGFEGLTAKDSLSPEVHRYGRIGENLSLVRWPEVMETLVCSNFFSRFEVLRLFASFVDLSASFFN